MKAKKGIEIIPEDLSDLVSIGKTKEWETLCRLMGNRIYKDKTYIVNYPEDEPVKLAIKKAYYRGRIDSLYALQSQVSQAPTMLEKLEEK